MTKIKKISPLSLAKIQGILFGLMGLVFVVPFLFLSFIFPIDSSLEGSSFPSFWFFFLVPVLYAVMGFIMGFITALLYNVVAKWVGGLEITIE
jgi:hypothetical protein